MTSWQPIDTAPQEGYFLCWDDGFYDVVDAGNNYQRPDGKIEYFNGDIYRCPSHWMPLPPPPTGAAT